MTSCVLSSVVGTVDFDGGISRGSRQFLGIPDPFYTNHRAILPPLHAGYPVPFTAPGVPLFNKPREFTIGIPYRDIYTDNKITVILITHSPSKGYYK